MDIFRFSFLTPVVLSVSFLLFFFLNKWLLNFCHDSRTISNFHDSYKYYVAFKYHTK